MEEKNIAERIKHVFRSYFGYLAVTLVSLTYVAASFITVSATGKSVGEIIADGVIAFLVGMLINRMFETQGVINGDADERVILANSRHANMVDSVAPYLDVLDDWCDVKNAEALARARRQYLSRYGMRYRDYFEADGTPIPPKKSVYRGFLAHLKHRKEIREEGRRLYRFERALHLKLSKLSAGILISDSGTPADPYFLGRSKREYSSESARRDVWSKLSTAFLFGYYGVQLITGFSVADLIWTVLQLSFFLLMGAIKMEQSYLFVTDEYRSRVNKKTDILQMFRLYLGKEKERDDPKV